MLRREPAMSPDTRSGANPGTKSGGFANETIALRNEEEKPPRGRLA
jgi:hypothetical protein